MKQTVTRTVTYRGCRLHARAVPQMGKAGFNAEVVVCRLIDGDPEDYAVQLKAWLHASADKALQYGLDQGRDWVESHLVAVQRSQ
jgi:hypothetical protein